MTKTARKHPAQPSQQSPDRLSHALNFANELNDSRLWKIRISYEKRWTNLKRTKAKTRITLQKPWLRSTGPRSAEGKTASSRNAQKGDFFDRAVFLPALKANERFLNSVSHYLRLKRTNHRAADDFHTLCLAMAREATAGLEAALVLGHTIFLPKSPAYPVYLRPL